MRSTAWNFPAAALPLLAALAACSSDVSREGSREQERSASGAEAALTDGSARIVAVQSDERTGGYVVRGMNGGGSRRVDALDLTATGVDLRALVPSLCVAGAVALRGAIHARTFVATDVYRALPGTAAARGDSFYGAERATDGSIEATEVNQSWSLPFDRLDAAPAAAPYVDERWLAGRVLASGAIVAGSFDVAGDGALVLRASQVLLRVPEQIACPGPLFIACAEGTSPSYERTVERCTVQTGCAAPGDCRRTAPECAAGYTLATWRDGTGCAAYACDPTFDPAPRKR